MITPRQTRLIRVPDLQRFQQVIAMLALGGPLPTGRERAVLVPTAGAAQQLRHTFEDLALVERWEPEPADLDLLGVCWPFGPRGMDAVPAPAADAFVVPHLVTRAGLYELLRERLADPGVMVGRIEREVIMERAAAAAAERGSPPPFAVRPALLSEMLAFLDVLGRERRSIEDFERLVGGPLESGATIDRGARRLLQQTRFLAAAFRAYGEMLSASEVLDEHRLGARLLAHRAPRALEHLVITVPDRSASPQGLWPADYDLLTRLPGLTSISVVGTEAMLGTGYLPRLLDSLPEIAVVSVGATGSATPRLAVPEADGARFFVSRDREDELVDLADRLRARPPAAGARAAVVYQRPLPYLALARQAFGAAGLSWQALDAQPLGSEPYAAAVDLVLSFVTTTWSRTAGIALLRAPQFRLGLDDVPPTGEAIAAADRELGEAFFLGGRDRLRELHDRWAQDAALEGTPPAPRPRTDHARTRRREALPAVAALLAVCAQLATLEDAAPPSAHLAVLEAFLRSTNRPPDDPTLRLRHARAQAAILAIVQDLARAFVRHGNYPRPFADLAALIRGLIEEHTFSPRAGPGLVQLLDARAAPYGRYEDVTLVGLTETEWPESNSRSIFYPLSLLRELGWPAEADRRSAARAAFDDLLRLPTRIITLSTVLLEDDAVVRPSGLLEDLERLELTTSVAPAVAGRTTDLALHPAIDALERREWSFVRGSRLPSDPQDGAGSMRASAYSVTSIDRYRECPFKYFAAYVLRLDEEREDRPGLTPLERGAFVHAVFHEFFARWGAAGKGTIDLTELDAARRLFTEVVDEKLDRLPDSERSLERARLVGSAAGSGVGERVFRFEAGRPLPILSRLLEVSLSGDRVIKTGDGERTVRLRGTADRIDLVADGTLRLVDYKTGKASSAKKTLQVPVYALCAEQHLYGHAGRTWRVAEGGYLAFGRDEPYASVVTPDNRETVLAGAAAALLETVDAIERGDFPVDPEEPHMCTFCGFAAVCRKDYVDDV